MKKSKQGDGAIPSRCEAACISGPSGASLTFPLISPPFTKEGKGKKRSENKELVMAFKRRHRPLADIFMLV